MRRALALALARATRRPRTAACPTRRGLHLGAWLQIRSTRTHTAVGDAALLELPRSAYQKALQSMNILQVAMAARHSVRFQIDKFWKLLMYHQKMDAKERGVELEFKDSARRARSARTARARTTSRLGGWTRRASSRRPSGAGSCARACRTRPREVSGRRTG